MQATVQTIESKVTSESTTVAQTVEAARTLTALEMCMVGGGRGSVSLE